MKIDSIELYHVAMPLIYPWRTAYGEDPDIHSVLVKMTSGENYGWAEATPLKAPCYLPDWTGGVFAVMKEFLAPQLVGQDIKSAEGLLDLLAPFKGNSFAKGGLEVAWWILKAKEEGKPLHKLLGGKTAPVRVGADFGVQDSIDMLLKKIQWAVDKGFPRVKLKFRRGWDVNMLKAVRDLFPDFTFHIDCNAGFSLADSDLFKKVDRFNLEMIEQPLYYADLIDHAKLQKQLSTPVCLDESAISPKAVEQAIELGSCRYMNIKVCRVGGLANSVKIHNMCMEAGIPCWVGGMLESAVGSGASLELATLPNFKYPADVFTSDYFYKEDLATPETTLCAPGKMDVSKVPGTPYEPKENILKRDTVNKAVIKA